MAEARRGVRQTSRPEWNCVRRSMFGEQDLDLGLVLCENSDLKEVEVPENTEQRTVGKAGAIFGSIVVGKAARGGGPQNTYSTVHTIDRSIDHPSGHKTSQTRIFRVRTVNPPTAA